VILDVSSHSRPDGATSATRVRNPRPAQWSLSPPALLFGDDREEPPLLTSAAPDLGTRGREPVSIFLWRFPDNRAGTTPPLDEGARQRLRALGYLE